MFKQILNVQISIQFLWWRVTNNSPSTLPFTYLDNISNLHFSYDVREDIQAFGKHWYDDGNLGGRAFFGGENKTSYLSIENLKTTDQGAYRCRVDFKKAPSQIYKLYLEVVGKIFSLVAQRLPWLQSLPCHHGMCILLALNFCYIHSNVIHGNSTKRQNFKFLREVQCFSLR